MELISKSSDEQLKTLMNPQFLLGFSEHHILQVIANEDRMFTLDDVCFYVEIWNTKHAYKILDILNQVHGDISEVELHLFKEECHSDFELVNDFSGQWGDFLNDDSA